MTLNLLRGDGDYPIKVSSQTYARTWGVGAVLRAFCSKYSHVEVGYNGTDWGNLWLHPQPVHITGLGKKSRCS